MLNQNHTSKLSFALSLSKGRWPEILESLGINRSFLRNKHMPCPMCGGRDRFRFDDKEEGAFICSRCGAGKGLRLLQLYHGWSFKYALDVLAKFHGINRIVPPHILRQRENKKITVKEAQILSKDMIERRRNHNMRIWAAAHLIGRGDPVDVYLRSRGIELHSFPDSLRYHPCLPYYNDEDRKFVGNFPALVAIISNSDNRGVGVHRTYLGNGVKANVPQPKKLMSPVYPGALSGASIKLFEPIYGQLALAEGIETALSFFIATGIPVWATVSCWGLENVTLPPSVGDVVICVDNDESGTGQKAAINLSRRLVAEGRKVRRVIPGMVGLDINDILLMGVSHDH